MTRAEFPLEPAQPLPVLRRTDLVYRLTGDAVPDGDGDETGPARGCPSRTVKGPGRAVAVLYGAQPADARAALVRAGVTGPIEVRPATGEDLLIAAVHCALPDPVTAGEATAATVTADPTATVDPRATAR